MLKTDRGDGLANTRRKVRRRETVGRTAKGNRRRSFPADGSDKLGFARHLCGVLEVLAKRQVGRVNALESLFCIETFVLVVLKAIGMP